MIRQFILIPILTIFCALALQLGAENEKHLTNIQQLTFGGENAEAYFSSDGKQLIFQSTRDGYPCDQIYTMNIDGSGVKKISTGKGRTTCAYFYPGDKEILYSSTHESGAACPPPPDRSRGYVWGLYPYDIYTANPDGSDLKILTSSPNYDAEATISPDGKSIVFTSDRDGDLELYRMDPDGKNVRRLTNFPGYDGGAFFSYDSKQIVWRGNHITDPAELAEYQTLLKEHLVKPTRLEIYVMNADGTNIRQVTHNGAGNFCPYFHPDGKRIIFASNMNDPSHRNFDLYIIGTDGNHEEQITFNPTFDGFPMFSPDGKKLVFASNRNDRVEGETNIFIADWVEGASDINESDLHKDIGYLASDAMKGRLTGTPEARKAAEYIATEFKKAGLQLVPKQSTPFQAFEFISGLKLGKTNVLSVKGPGEQKSYTVEKDFIPAGFSEDGNLENSPVVFAGYGIRAPDLQYDNYRDLDVKGKVVVVYRFGPEGDDPKSSYATYYPVRYKGMIARDQGAAALLVVSETKEDDELLTLRRDTSFGTSGIPILSVKRDVILDWMKMAGVELPDPTNPHATMSFSLPNIQVSLTSQLLREKSTSDNVLGWLPAEKPTEETIVIGAHYDHLGLGIEGSLAPKWGEVHNGADDNASGTAGVMELARVFGARKGNKRNLLFVAFGGEELGVLGSSYFVKNPVVPLNKIVAMLNMDMIGRLREQKLVVGGTGTSPEWNQILEDANRFGLKVTKNEDGYGPSDHSVFYAKNIPVLFFFTGAHPQYHKPEDDANLIEYKGEVTVLDYVEQITNEILDLPSPPQFTRVNSRSEQIATSGFRVYLGTIPDYTEEVKGVKLSGVREGSPAERAGIRGGDIIVEFGGRQIDNVYDYTYALQEHKPGDVVTVIVLRGDERVSLEVTLERRARTQ
jgi:Tol biopolymer transport system component